MHYLSKGLKISDRLTLQSSTELLSFKAFKINRFRIVLQVHQMYGRQNEEGQQSSSICTATSRLFEGKELWSERLEDIFCLPLLLI